MAATGARIAGLVRVDANLAAVFDDAQLEWLLSTYRREYPETPEKIEAVRRTRDEFVAASPKRRAVFAGRSGPDVMRDRPEIVLDAIGEVVAAVHKEHA